MVGREKENKREEIEKVSGTERQKGKEKEKKIKRRRDVE